MVSAPLRQTLSCQACRGRFVVHLFFSDAPGEPHGRGRCPWCGQDGTAPTGTMDTPSSFLAVGAPTNTGVVELALANVCESCDTFLVDDSTTCTDCGRTRRGRPPRESVALEGEWGAWERRLDEPRRWKVTYQNDAGRLTISGKGNVELHERDWPLFYRGKYEPASVLEVRIWRARVPSRRARHIANLLVHGLRQSEISLIPDEYSTFGGIEHRDAALHVGFRGRRMAEDRQLDEADAMLNRLCDELQRTRPARTVPTTSTGTRGQYVPVVPIVPVARVTPPTVETIEAKPEHRDCVVCDTPSAFVRGTGDALGHRDAVFWCPSCRVEFTVQVRRPSGPRKIKPHQIPDDECPACSTPSPFTGRVAEVESGPAPGLYAVHRCPQCREDYNVWASAFTHALDRVIGAEALASASVEAVTAEVLRSPRADLPRLRFAAVVGTSDPLRAALVTAQLAAARLRRRGTVIGADLDARIAKLLANRDRVERWSAGVDAIVAWRPGTSCMTTRHLELRRGFVEGICVTARQFVDNAEAIFGLAPIIDLGVTVLGEASAELFASPYLAQLRSLCLYNTGATDEDVRRLADAPQLARLAYLDLGFCQITDAGLEALCRSKHLQGLRYVRVSSNPCADPNPSFDEQDGRRYGLLPTARAMDLREKFGSLSWLEDRYTSEEPPSVEAFR